MSTCIELEPVEPPGRHEAERPRHPSPSISHRPLSTQTLPRKPQWPNHLEPVGRWIRSGGSYVPGFPRHLPDGWTASDETRDRARRVGIILQREETWVRAHIRGVPEGIEIRFWWHAPTSSNSSVPSRHRARPAAHRAKLARDGQTPNDASRSGRRGQSLARGSMQITYGLSNVGYVRRS